ncbi:heme exporter protein CcmD [Psychromonas sp. psych-6C06]|uniref:heme exporter protein CcmD n=1 Tax=Psychromonas sp. psych-6C06 TaxID=2058089 RepID=UPI000C31D69B|nr:heme exporter protein CcmD [Psychromonas sp. psych-6C06]PKF62916.1 heme exporter protein CcmD [Psychromonas sp. psych-6C06]
MAFNSFSDFIAMGGYGFYVWLSYGLSFFALIILVVNSVAKKNKILKNVEQRLAREERIKKAKNLEGTL